VGDAQETNRPNGAVDRVGWLSESDRDVSAQAEAEVAGPGRGSTCVGYSLQEDFMKRQKTIRALVIPAAISAVFASGCAFGAMKAGPGDVPFWIGIQDLQQLDQQVTRLLADRAAVIALRTPDDPQGVQLRATVAKLKHAMPQTPVLTYAWSSRNLRGKKGSAGVMDWLDSHGELQVHEPGGGRGLSRFGDVRLAGYREKTAASIAAAVSRGGADGVILDMSIRTPQYRPHALAKICASNGAFCESYAQGMDATLDAIRKALGDRAMVYNGLWNFGPGSVADQQKLLDHADAAAVEYFGGDPKVPQHSFTQDVLPFLQAMAKAPADKEILVFGRGSITYTSYAEDYARQRYLYCAYLLGKRDNTYFKYHSTFQADVPDGRTGGLSVYADWSSNIGAPSKPYSVASGLYSRPFAHGLVIVAPDDGRGGSYALPHAMYSPEGEKYENRVTMQPGQGLLLLDAKQADASDQHLLDLKLLADWPGSSMFSDGSGSGVSLQDGAPTGSHDMLLDAVRSAKPRNTLQLMMQPGGKVARMDVVAEVDDPSHRNEFAILAIGGPNPSAGDATVREMTFRAAASRRTGSPVVQGQALVPGQWQTLTLDGRALFAKSGLVFRRWDYVRFGGAMKLKAVKLAD
jgi:hypothetical protein